MTVLLALRINWMHSDDVTPLELAEESLSLLTLVLDEAFQRAPENDLHSAFVYRHARNISDLGDDVLALELQERSSASRIVIRPMLESLFRLVAAINQPTYAAEKLVAELEEEVERIDKWVAVDQSSNFQKEMSGSIALVTAYADQLRREHAITTRNRWSVFDTARVAKLDWQYARDYFLYSKYVHSTISGIISQEYQVGRGHIMQTAIFTILAAVGYAVQGIATDTPQKHIDEATRLMGVGMEFMKTGGFRDPEEAAEP